MCGIINKLKSSEIKIINNDVNVSIYFIRNRYNNVMERFKSNFNDKKTEKNKRIKRYIIKIED